MVDNMAKREECVVCKQPAQWETKRKGEYPLLCDHCLSQLPHAVDKIDLYKFIG